MGLLDTATIEIHSYECVDCKRTLPREKYYWHKRGHRHSASCKDCYQIKRRPYQIAYMARRGTEQRRKNYSPEKRSISIIKSYGLTLESYEQLLASQSGGCAICGSKEPKTKRNGRFCVDHNHQTGAVRGLLCAPCNRGIGLLKDDPAVIEKAMNYLIKANGSRKQWGC